MSELKLTKFDVTCMHAGRISGKPASQACHHITHTRVFAGHASKLLQKIASRAQGSILYLRYVLTNLSSSHVTYFFWYVAS